MLGKEHYLFETLQARKYYFEAKIQQDTLASRHAFFKAMEWEPNMPHAVVGLMKKFFPEQVEE